MSSRFPMIFRLWIVMKNIENCWTMYFLFFRWYFIDIVLARTMVNKPHSCGGCMKNILKHYSIEKHDETLFPYNKANSSFYLCLMLFHPLLCILFFPNFLFAILNTVALFLLKNQIQLKKHNYLYLLLIANLFFSIHGNEHIYKPIYKFINSDNSWLHVSYSFINWSWSFYI